MPRAAARGPPRPRVGRTEACQVRCGGLGVCEFRSCRKKGPGGMKTGGKCPVLWPPVQLNPK